MQIHNPNIICFSHAGTSKTFIIHLSQFNWAKNMVISNSLSLNGEGLSSSCMQQQDVNVNLMSYSEECMFYQG